MEICRAGYILGVVYDFWLNETQNSPLKYKYSVYGLLIE